MVAVVAGRSARFGELRGGADRYRQSEPGRRPLSSSLLGSPLGTTDPQILRPIFSLVNTSTNLQYIVNGPQ